MSKKYYRVIKDTFMWEAGAILKFDSSQGSKGGYEAISDIWDATTLYGEYISKSIIEENPDWFERVYEINVLGKVSFATKEVAKATAAKLFKGK